MPATTIVPAIISYLLSSSPPPINEAFNTYDSSTFSGSTCKPLDIEVPVGIFASPDGKSTALGTENDPLDLATALANNDKVKDGDTLWLMEGTYEGTFTSELRGSENSPITVKPYPGKRVIIDTTNATGGSGLRINGYWANYYGIEVLSRDTKRETTSDNYDDNNITLQNGVNVYGTKIKVINFISHDNSGGINSWFKGEDERGELYGNIIYNNGWSSPKRGHGHAIYAQNRNGYKKLHNNIIFFGFATGIHVYTEGGYIDNFDIQDNVWFLTGASDTRASQKKDNCLVGGFKPVRNLLIKNNLGYSDNSRGTRIGYGGDVVGQSAIIQDNYLVENFWVAGNWDRLDMSNTSVFHGITGSSQSQINDLGGNDFRESDPISGKKIFVSKNRYDARRARVVIYNFDEDESVSVDLSSILKNGEAYRIHSVFNLFGKAIKTGVYSGSNISIPMGTVAPPQPNGLDGISEEDDPKKKFGVFVVTHAGCL